MKKAQAGRSEPLVIVQWIEVEWGKDARSAELAAKRNRLPNAFLLPELEVKLESRIVVQRVSFSDAKGFDVPTEHVEQSERLTLPRLPGIELAFSDGQLIATPKQELKWTDVYRPQIGVLLAQWSRLIWNERVKACEGQWRYRQTALNIAYLAHFSSSIFLDQPPVSERVDLRHLY